MEREAAAMIVRHSPGAKHHQLKERKTTLVDKQKDTFFLHAEFWTSDNPTHVNHTCADKNVLVGIEFEMWSDGVGRHPSTIKYICRELTP